MKFLVVLLVLAAGCVSSQPYVEVAGERVNVEMADSAQEWERGLMFRESLAPGSGMLFVFPDEAVRSFWMKNTLIPLDIIFVDSGGIVVNITKNAQPCRAILCESYLSGRPAKYVLEVNGGFSDSSSLKIGDALKISVV